MDDKRERRSNAALSVLLVIAMIVLLMWVYTSHL
jgi:hypothetical protein